MQPSKPSDMIAIYAMLWGAMWAGGLFYLWPTAHWVVYLVVWLFFTGPAYMVWLNQAANKKIIDQHDHQ
jgi:hypothetical protein